MPKACDLKRGDIILLQSVPHMVEELRISTPSARGASSLYHFRFRNLQSRAKLDQTCKGDDPFTACAFSRRPVQLSYKQNDDVIFMDMKDFSEILFKSEDIKDQLSYMSEEMDGIQVMICDDRPIGLELPPVATLPVVQCDPSIRGASATARTKTAVLSTGREVQVPEYLEQGDVIRVDTRSGEFLGRA